MAILALKKEMDLSGSSPCTSSKHAVSCIRHRLAIQFIESKNAVRRGDEKHQLLLCDDLECIQPQCLPWILVDSFKLEIVCAFFLGLPFVDI